jgi:hypothetical protein
MKNIPKVARAIASNIVEQLILDIEWIKTAMFDHNPAIGY